MADYKLHLGDCLEFMQGMEPGSVDAVITDPPYPDWYADEYNYKTDGLDFLKVMECRQLVFWSARFDFPISEGVTSTHIWDKKTGTRSQYEKIIERNGLAGYRVFRHYLINSTVAASFTRDTFTGHKSQKPINLLYDLVLYATNPGDVVFDPFMGSGTTGVACGRLGRNFIGCELDPGYFKIAEQRIKNAYGDYVPTDKEKANGQVSMFEIIKGAQHG